MRNYELWDAASTLQNRPYKSGQVVTRTVFRLNKNEFSQTYQFSYTNIDAMHNINLNHNNAFHYANYIECRLPVVLSESARLKKKKIGSGQLADELCRSYSISESDEASSPTSAYVSSDAVSELMSVAKRQFAEVPADPTTAMYNVIEEGRLHSFRTRSPGIESSSFRSLQTKTYTITDVYQPRQWSVWRTIILFMDTAGIAK